MAKTQAASRNGVYSVRFSAKELLRGEVKKRGVVPKIKRPKFADEAEEAAWYPAHPEFVEALFQQAKAEGKLGRATAAKALGITQPTTIRLSTEDLSKAKRQAKKKGLGYQTYIKMLLREALAQAEHPKRAA